MMEKWLFLEHLAWTVSDDERFCSLWSTTYCVCLYNCLRNTKIRTRRRSPTPWKTKGSLKIVCAVFWLWSLTCSSFSDESENEREKKLIKSLAQIKNKSTASHFSAKPPKNINHISSSAQSVMMTKVLLFNDHIDFGAGSNKFLGMFLSLEVSAVASWDDFLWTGASEDFVERHDTQAVGSNDVLRPIRKGKWGGRAREDVSKWDPNERRFNMILKKNGSEKSVASALAVAALISRVESTMDKSVEKMFIEIADEEDPMGDREMKRLSCIMLLPVERGSVWWQLYEGTHHFSIYN